MKRVFFSVVLLLVTGLSFAQENNVKEAKNIANGTNPDFAKAEKLINQALTNAETKDDANTWNIAGFVQKRKNDKQMESAYLRQPYDTVVLYNSALKMCQFYFKCDELAQIPNEKGKIKNKFRKTNAAAMLSARNNLINGGVYYFNLDNSKEAFPYFATYVDMKASPMFAEDANVQNDTIISQIAYYAALAALKSEDYANVQKYAQFGIEDKEVGKFCMQYIADSYKAQGDTAKWITALQDGLQKYPEHSIFFGALVDYYTANNKYDEAMAFADNMLAKDSNNSFYLYVKGYLYLNMKQYDKAIEFYDKTIAIDPKHADAYSYKGLAYCLQAQDFSEKATTDETSPKYAEDQKTLKAFYEKAKPCYEQARSLQPEKKDLWLQGLYRVYYMLKMDSNLQEIESMM